MPIIGVRMKGTLHRLGIDVTTRDAIKLILRLERLVGTVEVRGPFPYNEEASLAQLHYTGDMNQPALDAWLHRTNHGAEYIGTFKRIW